MNTLPRALLFLLLAVAFLLPQKTFAQSEEEAVLAVAQKVFDGINTKNADLIRTNMTPEAILYATVNGVARHSSLEDFTSQVAGASDAFHERMFESTVHIQDGIAMIWADYDFHVNGTFSHCGVDTFSLVKTREGWKVASLIYTVQQEGCVSRPPIPTSPGN